jgi:Uncharacterized conserved protein
MEPTTRNIRNEASSLADTAADKARSLANGGLSQFQDRAEDVYHDLQKRAREGMDVSEDLIKSHPFYAVLGACAVGFICGSLIGRRR